MSDIVERLRNPHWVESGTFKTLRSSTAVADMMEAAEEIERLRAIVRDFAKESTYSDALIANLLNPGGDLDG